MSADVWAWVLGPILAFSVASDCCCACLLAASSFCTPAIRCSSGAASVCMDISIGSDCATAGGGWLLGGGGIAGPAPPAGAADAPCGGGRIVLPPGAACCNGADDCPAGRPCFPCLPIACSSTSPSFCAIGLA